MQYKPLGSTTIQVSQICLGSMTWGEQNTEQQAHEQLDYAISQGINFIDTAEMYPVPPRVETQGKTEQYIGSWLHKRGKREDLILATKIAGPAKAGIASHIRNGQTTHNLPNIQSALDGSLKRLQTDYVDLYQLHWPARTTNFFGKLGYEHVEEESTPIRETLEALKQMIKAGKIRYIGLSNETPWGVGQFVKLAQEYNLPHIVSIQNPYSLLNRTFEIGLAEIAIREKVGLLAYSPLGFGMLSGKYLNNQKPAGARLTLWSRFGRYNSAKSLAATERYVALAHKFGLDPAQMALAFVNQQPFLTSNIIGATNLEQLKSDIKSIEIVLNEEQIQEINAIHADIPNPAP